MFENSVERMADTDLFWLKAKQKRPVKKPLDSKGLTPCACEPLSLVGGSQHSKWKFRLTGPEIVERD